MAKELISRGHSVLIICGSFDVSKSGLSNKFHKGRRRGYVEGIEVLEFQLSYSNSLSFIKRSIVFIQFAFFSTWFVLSEKSDLIFATTTPLTVGIPAIAAKVLKSKPFVFEVRDLWPELPVAMGVIKNPIIINGMKFLEWISYRSADRLIGLSPGIVAGIKSKGVPLDKLTMISNGCDVDLFKNAKLINIKGKEKGDFIAIYSGAHGIANDIDAALNAAIILKERGVNNIKLFFIGAGMLRSTLIKKAKVNELSNCFFLEPVSKRELANLLKSADLGMQLLKNVSAFYEGTSPNKFFDYIASGLPVLNNYPGWISNVIQENNCGYAIAPNDPIAFADALENAANNPKKIQSMGQQSQKVAKTIFNRKILAKKFCNWLEGTVK